MKEYHSRYVCDSVSVSPAPSNVRAFRIWANADDYEFDELPVVGLSAVNRHRYEKRGNPYGPRTHQELIDEGWDYDGEAVEYDVLVLRDGLIVASDDVEFCDADDCTSSVLLRTDKPTEDEIIRHVRIMREGLAKRKEFRAARAKEKLSLAERPTSGKVRELFGGWKRCERPTRFPPPSTSAVRRRLRN